MLLVPLMLHDTCPVPDTATDEPIVVRLAEPRDVDQCAHLAELDGAGETSEWASTFHRTVSDDQRERVLFVAVVGASVVGYARAVRLFGTSSEEGATPPGWYLLGIVVEPGFRRRGTGSRLTTARLTWLRQRVAEAYFFTAPTNVASIRLHIEAGFDRLPGVTRVPSTADGSPTEQWLFRIALATPDSAEQSGVPKR